MVFKVLCILIPTALAMAGATSAGPPGAPPPGSFAEGPPPPQVPVMPYLQPCTAFPGTYQWNECWAQFHGRINSFNQAMANYGATYKAWESSFPGEGPITTSNVAGMQLRARGIPDISSRVIRGRIYVDALVGEEDKLEVRRNINTVKFDLFDAEGKLKHWIRITPPEGIDADQVRYHRDEDMLHIWAKGKDGLTFQGDGSFYQSSSGNSWSSGK